MLCAKWSSFDAPIKPPGRSNRGSESYRTLCLPSARPVPGLRHVPPDRASTRPHLVSVTRQNGQPHSSRIRHEKRKYGFAAVAGKAANVQLKK
jgi:hypothetical protein